MAPNRQMVISSQTKRGERLERQRELFAAFARMRPEVVPKVMDRMSLTPFALAAAIALPTGFRLASAKRVTAKPIGCLSRYCGRFHAADKYSDTSLFCESAAKTIARAKLRGTALPICLVISLVLPVN
jgi:hypothetical protein